MRHPTIWTALVMGILAGCGGDEASEDVEVSETTEVEAVEEVQPPAAVRLAALSVRSSLLLGLAREQLDVDLDQLAAEQRRWFGGQRKACLARLPVGQQPTDDLRDELEARCSNLQARLRERLELQPALDQEPSTTGVPGTAIRLLDHGFLRFVGASIELQHLEDAVAALVRHPETLEPASGSREAGEAIDALTDAVLAVQRGRLVDLAEAMRFADDEDAITVVLGEEVSSWLWLPAVDSAAE